MKKVLIVSHNSFSNTESMGKTLKSYFCGFDSKYLAQFYIHSEVPTTKICLNYYRITDIDMIKSIFTRKSGHSFVESEIDCDRVSPRTDKGNVAKLYQLSRNRKPYMYVLRNLWWSLGKWNTRKLNKWIDSFDPDAVFFASGDFSYMYKIALKIAKDRNIPLYISCMDDYYFFKDHFGSKILYKFFYRQVKKTMEYSANIFCICEAMSKDYEELFRKKCYTLHTATSIEKIDHIAKNKICYLGNVGLSRNDQLVKIGKTLKNMNLPIKKIDIYSSEVRSEILKNFTEENGISYHGAVSAEEVKKIMGESIALIHTESFSNRIHDLVKYSISTKIPDSLASGVCILAYGPSDIASISYLKENNAALCAETDEELKQCLHDVFENTQKVNVIQNNAICLAKRNHSIERNYELLRKIVFM